MLPLIVAVDSIIHLVIAIVCAFIERNIINLDARLLLLRHLLLLLLQIMLEDLYVQVDGVVGDITTSTYWLLKGHLYWIFLLILIRILCLDFEGLNLLINFVTIIIIILLLLLFAVFAIFPIRGFIPSVVAE